jgi:hypothetical protein
MKKKSAAKRVAVRAVKAPASKWAAKLVVKKDAKRVRLETPFAGVAAGQMLFVATPQIVVRYVRRIPRGQTRTIERLRRELARANKCDATCPVSTAIFLRIGAEAAWEAIQSGAAASEVMPFWRVIAPGSPIAKRLSVDSKWLAAQREAEGIAANAV